MATLKSASASESLVQGTPLYMSPEALRGRRPDATFDIWGLTVTLFEALVGRPLWNDFRAVRRAADLESEPFDIRGAAPELSPALIEFFTDALSPRPAERPRSARELADRLARLMSHSSSWPEPAARSFGGASNTEAST